MAAWAGRGGGARGAGETEQVREAWQGADARFRFYQVLFFQLGGVQESE